MIPFLDTDFLKKVTVLVETFSKEGDGTNPLSSGSGVLYKKDNEVFVFTCAHCICEDNSIDLQALNHKYKTNIKYKLNNSDSFTPWEDTSIVFYKLSEILDIAVIKIQCEVNLIIPEYFLTTHSKQMTEFELGFNGYPNGLIQRDHETNIESNLKNQFDIENAKYICDDTDYNFEIKHSIDDNTRQKEISENIKGFSGSGIFISRDGKNYLIGLFKESKTRANESNKLNLFNKCLCVGIKQLDNFLDQRKIYTTHFGFETNKRNYYSPIPYFNKQGFIGRVDYSIQIRDKFFFNNMNQIAVFGNGGIGKTQIALNYFYENKEKYDYAFWIGCEEKENVKISSNKSIFFQDIIKCIKIIEDSNEFSFLDSETNLIEKFKSYLSKISKVLIIFDNLDPLSDKKPQELYVYKKIIDILSVVNIQRGHVLVTTQYRGLPEFDSIEVKGFSPEESVSFFKNKIPNLLLHDKDEFHLNELIHELGYLPLALEQAASYLRRNTNIKRYIEKYKKLNDKFKTIQLEEIKGSRSHERSVKATFYLTIGKIKNPLTIYMLFIICFLNPDNIPKDIFEIDENLFSKGDPIHYFYQQESMENVFLTLLDYSIIQLNDENSFRIHRLIQQIIISDLKEKTNLIFLRLKKILLRLFRQKRLQLALIKTYSQAFWYSKAFEYIEILISKNKDLLGLVYYDSLVTWIGKKSSIALNDQEYSNIIEQYNTRAEKFINEYIDSIDDQDKKIVELIRLISENKSSYQSLYQLAYLYLNGKQFNKALYYFELAHSINKEEKAMYPYLAYLYLYNAKRKTNYYKKAKSFAKKAYKNNLSNTFVYYTLAEVSKHEGKYLDAITYYNELRKSSSSEKTEVLTSMFHCYLKLQHYDLAMQISDEIIQRDSSNYLGYYLKGKALISGGESKTGFDLLNQSLSKEGVRKEKVFLSIANFYFNEKKYESALEYYNKINYTETLKAKANIGLIYFAKREYTDALKIFLDLHHNDNFTIPKIIAKTYENLKQYNEAIQFILKIDDEDENSKYFQVCKIYFKIKEYQEALRIANAIIKRGYYNDEIFHLRGSIYFKLQKYKLSLTDFKRVEKLYLTNKVKDKRFMNLLKNISLLYSKLGDQPKYQLYLQKFNNGE